MRQIVQVSVKPPLTMSIVQELIEQIENAFEMKHKEVAMSFRLEDISYVIRIIKR